jgi:hypothetical protein
MMPGGTAEAYKYIEPIVTKVAAQVRNSCVRAMPPACLLFCSAPFCGVRNYSLLPGLICGLLFWHVTC